MRWNREHLATLTAIVETGTFDAAAKQLSMTASAVSQRIRALENQAGQVLIVRGTPCVPTEAGLALVRLTKQMELSESEAATVLDKAHSAHTVSIAVNADSMATWFARCLPDFAALHPTSVEIHLEDQQHSAELLRTAQVMAAVTSDPHPVQGCSAQPLAVMRYVPAARADVVVRHTERGKLNWNTLPVVHFNPKDAIQRDLLAERGATPETQHTVPSSEGFARAVLAGMGWGAMPLLQCQKHFDSGKLVPLEPDLYVDIPLYWQRWKIESKVLDALGDIVRKRAQAI
ncbi:LysR family transcriptional regulator (chromosome initiation inhibitor) [Neomicrococcus aestuarii]|uniref:LysR family transcriptional regulator (Chromosome initiation inhibitor) n=1 Tax=Neomicrococcus aestuarii TaxID=556325 RepID=A0A7W8TTX7_9MICC|nr:LysR family transcriptional regulator ArgP [Neomicrococcus aestuarii]MBB5512847.1 LysR family transcriptional regulator (chromosome initiation inhibitor) [Neomicrococcus aestuarii]